MRRRELLIGVTVLALFMAAGGEAWPGMPMAAVEKAMGSD